MLKTYLSGASGVCSRGFRAEEPAARSYISFTSRRPDSS